MAGTGKFFTDQAKENAALGISTASGGIYERVVQAALVVMNPEHYAVSINSNSDGSINLTIYSI